MVLVILRVCSTVPEAALAAAASDSIMALKRLRRLFDAIPATRPVIIIPKTRNASIYRGKSTGYNFDSNSKKWGKARTLLFSITTIAYVAPAHIPEKNAQETEYLKEPTRIRMLKNIACIDRKGSGGASNKYVHPTPIATLIMSISKKTQTNLK
jgi:hypothetical protein